MGSENGAGGFCLYVLYKPAKFLVTLFLEREGQHFNEAVKTLWSMLSPRQANTIITWEKTHQVIQRKTSYIMIYITRSLFSCWLLDVLVGLKAP